MFAGTELFAALADHYPLYVGGAVDGPVSIETFPQAVACALAGQIVSAKQTAERLVRSALLRATGLDPALFANIDEIDAALCTLAADALARSTFTAYGDATGGLIIVPRDPLPAVSLPGSVARAVPSLAVAKILQSIERLPPHERSEVLARLKEKC